MLCSCLWNLLRTNSAICLLGPRYCVCCRLHEGRQGHIGLSVHFLPMRSKVISVTRWESHGLCGWLGGLIAHFEIQIGKLSAASLRCLNCMWHLLVVCVARGKLIRRQNVVAPNHGAKKSLVHELARIWVRLWTAFFAMTALHLRLRANRSLDQTIMHLGCFGTMDCVRI